MKRLGILILIVVSCCKLSAADKAIHLLLTGRQDRDIMLVGRWLPLETDYGYRLTTIAAGRIWPARTAWDLRWFGGLMPKSETKFITALKAKDRPDVVVLGGQIGRTPRRQAWFYYNHEWRPNAVTEKLRAALIVYVNEGGVLVINSRTLFKTFKVKSNRGGDRGKERVYAWKPGPFDNLVPANESKKSAPFLGGVDKEDWPAWALKKTGKGKCILIELPRPVPFTKPKAHNFSFWHQFFQWAVKGDQAFPISLFLKGPIKDTNTGTPLSIPITSQIWDKTKTVSIKVTITDPFGTARVKRLLSPADIKDQQITIADTSNWPGGIFNIEINSLHADKSVIQTLKTTATILSPLKGSVKIPSMLLRKPELNWTYKIDGQSEKGLKTVLQIIDQNDRVLVSKTVSLNPDNKVEFTGVENLRNFADGSYSLQLRSYKNKVVVAGADSPFFISTKDPMYNQLSFSVWGFGDQSVRTIPLYKETGFNTLWAQSTPPAAMIADGKIQFSMIRHAQPGVTIDADDKAYRDIFRKRFLRPEKGMPVPRVQHPGMVFASTNMEIGIPVDLNAKAIYSTLFQKWLQQHYKTIEALNSSWNSQHKNWQDIKAAMPGRHGPKWKLSKDPKQSARIVDAYLFYIYQCRRQLQTWTDTVHELTDNKRGTSVHSTHWSHVGGIDYGHLINWHSWWSYDTFSWGALLHQPRFGSRPMSSSLWGFMGYPEMISLVGWHCLMNGVRNLDYWASTYPMGFGYPQVKPGNSIYTIRQTETHASRVVKKFISEIKKVESVFVKNEALTSADVAIYGAHQPWIHHYGLLAPLLRNNITPTVTDDLKTLKKFKLVFFGGGEFVSPEITTSLKSFVEAGGTLVTFPGVGRFDLHGKSWATLPGAGLDEVLGFKYPDIVREELPKEKRVFIGEEVVELGEDTVFDPRLKFSETINGSLKGLQLRASHSLRKNRMCPIRTSYRDQLSDKDISKGTKVLARYIDGNFTDMPAVLQRSLGKGQIFHLNLVQPHNNYHNSYHKDHSGFGFESIDESNQLIAALLKTAKAVPAASIRDMSDKPIPQIYARSMGSKNSKVRYLAAVSDYRQGQSHAFDSKTGNQAKEKVVISEKAISYSPNETAFYRCDKAAKAEASFNINQVGRYQLWVNVYFDRKNAVKGEANSMRILIDGKEKNPYVWHEEDARRYEIKESKELNTEEKIFGNTYRTNQWVWVSGLNYNLTKGKHTISFIAREGPVQIRGAMLINPPGILTKVSLDPKFKTQTVVDVISGKQIKLTGQSFTARFAPGEGRLFALLPYPISDLSLSTAKTIKPGDDIVCKIALADPSQKHSLALTVTANGKHLSYLDQILQTGKTTVTLKTALNDPKGKWIITVRDLSTGQSISKTVDVK
ncbi:MAG: beta-galactosidase [Lentisphaeria bacterium]|nr:beta-galactosidase [Lentisphaeria bacterium]